MKSVYVQAKFNHVQARNFTLFYIERKYLKKFYVQAKFDDVSLEILPFLYLYYPGVETKYMVG